MTTRILNDARDAYTAYICVLCGSVFNSRDYRWGACGENEGAVEAQCNDWSCPVCGGVVVEYARVPRPGGERPSVCAELR
jgi:hypothetical protein